MIDKSIMRDLQSWFPRQFELTSSHQFRSGKDMQFAFSYFYFMMNEPSGESHEDFLKNRIDTDKNGFISRGELRSLAALLRSSVTTTDLNQMFWQVVDPEVVDKKSDAGLDTFNIFSDNPLELVTPSNANRGRKNTPRQEALNIVGHHGGIPIAWMLRSKVITEQIEKALEKTPKYRHEIGDGNQVAFHMIGDKEDEVFK